MADLVGAERTADAGVFRPAVHARLEKGAIDDQLTPAFEQVEQAHPTMWSLERVGLFHGHPRHPPPFGGQRVAGAQLRLLLHQQLLARRLPGFR